MKWLAASLLVATFVADAVADVKPPTGWQSNPDFAAALSPRKDLFGGIPATVTTDVYRAPVAGAVLYVTRAEAKVTAEQRDAAASYEVLELRRVLDRAGSGAKVQAQSQRADAATKVVEGTLTWRDDAANLVSSQRTVIAADASRIVAVTGECVLAIDVAPAVARACEAALQTLEPEIAPAQRVALSITNAAEDPEATAAAAVPPPTGSATTSTGPGMSDASKLPPIAPIQVQPPPARVERETDRRPVYLGLGLLLLAVIFHMNRKRREKFEREDTPAPARPADDDDLHAAADDDTAPKKGDDDTN